MNIKIWAALAGAVVAIGVLDIPPAEAARKKTYVTARGYVVPASRPRARVRVAPRSFLDAGTEVLPGERKFTDYALPPNYMPIGVVTNVGGKPGWDRSPLMQCFDLPSRRNPCGW